MYDSQSYAQEEHFYYGLSMGMKLTTGFVSFVLPFASGWLIGKIAVLKAILWDFIKY